MPATAGRVRMPANNRVHSSAALQTHGIWQSAIGYDPYAPNKDESKNPSSNNVASSEPDAENAYVSFQGLLALARITGSNADEARGACRKCGRVGHLTFQCRNFLSVKDENRDNNSEFAAEGAVMSLSGLDKLKGEGITGIVNGKTDVAIDEESEEEEDESESSDSDADSEIERIIAKRYGKRVSGKGSKESSSKKKTTKGHSDGGNTDSDDKKKRGRVVKMKSRKRQSSRSDSEEEDEARRRRRNVKRRRYESSEEERCRRRRWSKREKDRKRRHHHTKAYTPPDADATSSDGYRVARHHTKQSFKSSRKHHHGHDDSS